MALNGPKQHNKLFFWQKKSPGQRPKPFARAISRPRSGLYLLFCAKTGGEEFDKIPCSFVKGLPNFKHAFYFDCVLDSFKL